MKRIVLLRCFVLSIFFLVSIGAYATELHPVLQASGVSPKFFWQSYPEEGFVAGTLVRVPGGCKSIELLSVNDFVLDGSGHPRKVLSVAKRFVNRCMQLKVENKSILVGCDNQIYVAISQSWITAYNCPHHVYVSCTDGYARHVQCEVVHEPAILYMVATEDHVFCLAPYNIVVHNADAVALGVGTIFLEYVACANPVAVIIGSTIALSTIARRAYQAYHQHKREKREDTDAKEEDDTSSDIPPAAVFLAERYYYEQRKQELETLREKFQSVYVGVKSVYAGSNFSNQFLKNITTQCTVQAFLKVSIADELQLSEERKTALRQLREQALSSLEREINELQTLLIVHFNGLIKQVYGAHDIYDAARLEVNDAHALWNDNRHATTDHIASQTYEKSILEECLVLDIKQKIAELKTVITHYRQCKNTACLYQSSNINEQLDRAFQIIAAEEQWVREQLKRITTNIVTVESYFVQRNIPIAEFKKQTQNVFTKEQSCRDAQAVKSAKNKQLDISSGGGGPKKDDDEEDSERKTVDAIKGAKKLADQLAEDARKRGWEDPDMPAKDDKQALNHIFSGKDGHDPYSDVRYDEMQRLVEDPANFLGKDKDGVQWFAKNRSDGKQEWAYAYGNKVKSGGTNGVPLPFDSEFGLLKPGTPKHKQYLKRLDKQFKP